MLVQSKEKKLLPGLTSQRHSALISSDPEYFQVCFSAVHYLKISEQRWFSSETELIQSWTALIFSETALKLEIFRAKKSALNQSCFSADFLWNRADLLWNSAETPNFQRKKISTESELFQRWFSLKQSWTALIFSETALKLEIFRAKKSALNQSCFSADFLWNRADLLWNSAETPNFQRKKISAESELFQRWFSLKQSWTARIFSETALKLEIFRAKKSALNQCCFSADFPWKRAGTHWSLLKQLSSFLSFPWDNAEHPETSYSFSANFCRKAQILSFPGNL